MSSTIKAITFDLWDTIIDDDSDEPKRRKIGLARKQEHRLELLCEAVTKENQISVDQVRLGSTVIDAAFLECWRNYSITWPYRVRVKILLNGLGLSLSENSLNQLVSAVENMEVDICPDPINGVGDALRELSFNYKLCIVSDTIITPGSGLRSLLKLHDLSRYFSGYAFSDEVGHSKPHVDMFASAAKQLGCNLNQMIHIGDRDHNDIKGPQALGMKAILFTGKRDDDKETTSADAICERHSDLPMIIRQLTSS